MKVFWKEDLGIIETKVVKQHWNWNKSKCSTGRGDLLGIFLVLLRLLRLGRFSASDSTGWGETHPVQRELTDARVPGV